MAPRQSKKRAAAESKPPGPAKKPKTNGKVAETVEEHTVVTPDKTRKPVGRPRGRTAVEQSSLVSPRTSPRLEKTAQPSTSGRVLGKKAKKKQIVSKLLEPVNTESQVSLQDKVIKIIKSSRAKLEEMDDLIEADSDDEGSSSSPPTSDQDIMEGDKDYVTAQHLQHISEEEDSREEALDLTITPCKLIQSVQDTTAFDDPKKANVDFWKEDPSRETTLVRLWEEEESLYNVSKKGHMTEDRASILKRFATVLKIPPHVIDTRMQSMRNMYQTLHRQAKSGSEPEGKTDRQEEVLKLLHFLRSHIKTTPSLSSYSGQSPAKATLVRGKSVMKSTPKNKGQNEAGPSGLDPSAAHSSTVESSLLDHSLTTIDSVDEPLISDVESDSGDAFESEQFVVNTKHFSRNQRLHDKKSKESVARRSLDMEAERSPSIIKRTDPKKRKSKDSVSQSVYKSSGSCKDSAPLASKRKPATVPKKSLITVVADVHANEDGTSGNPRKRKPASTGLEAMEANTAEERSLAYQTLKKNDLALRKQNDPSTTTAAQRRQLMATSVNDPGTQKQYDTNIDLNWFDLQGPGYRKQQEKEKKKKDQDRDEKFQEIMKEKNAHIKKLTEGLATSNNTGTISVADVSPEQLWADSLVPQVKRIPEDVRDEFMVHVLSVAMKAIRGKWP